MIKIQNSSFYGLLYSDNTLDTPTMNYYFKQVTIPYSLQYDIKESRKKLGFKN